MSMFSNAIVGVAVTLVTGQALAQTAPTANAPPAAPPSAQPPPAQYPRQPGAQQYPQQYPQQQPGAQPYPPQQQQPGAQPYPPQQQPGAQPYPPQQQPGAQPYPPQQYPQQYPPQQQPGAQPYPPQQYPQQYPPQQPGAQPYPPQQYPQQYPPQQPGAQPYPPQQYPPQQPGAQQYPQQYPPQQPGAQPYPPPQQYPQQYPSQQPGAQQNIQLQREAMPAAAEARPEIKVFSFVPRLGVQFGGSGTLESECTGSCGDAAGSGTPTDYELQTAVALELDFLFKIGSIFRLGPALLYTHTMDMKPDGTSSTLELGSITDLDLVAEFTPRVANKVWLTPRLQTGLSVFSASGDWETVEKAGKASCNSTAAQYAPQGVSVSGCDSFESPHVGYNIGASFGVMFAAGNRVRVRFDTLLKYYSIGLDEVKISGGGQTATISETASGTRFLLLGGIEI